QGSVLISTRTKSRADKVSKFLLDYGYSVTKIHGDRSQGQRNAAIKAFREGKFRILVATDIVARGLDIPHISLVVNYDLPQSPEDYIHRIGRTARAGAEGRALCLLLPDDKYQWARINKLYNPEVYKETLKQQQRESSRAERNSFGAGRPNKYGKKKATAKHTKSSRDDGGKAKRSFFSSRPGSVKNSRWQPEGAGETSRRGEQDRPSRGNKKCSKKKTGGKRPSKDSYFSKKFGKSKSMRG
ncbi:MAG: DEAD/DEAH box helicase, partial [Bdellovibrionales bacterium]|nr:DEAD/DEAH box helicase [Bdellovibrionales bacterium]